MDNGDAEVHTDHDGFEDAIEEQPRRELPADLPKSLDDRVAPIVYAQETEYYDAWQGQCRQRALHRG